MISFKFIETFFILSLGVSLLLMMLLIYHFKQRLYKTEEKVDTLFDIIQNLAQEVSSVRNNIDYMVHSQPNYGNHNPFSTSFPLQFVNMDGVKNDVKVHELDIDYQDLGEMDVTNHLEEIVELTDVEDENDDDEEEDDEEDEDDEDDDDEDEDEDNVDEDKLPSDFIKIKIQDDEPMDDILNTDVITDNLHIEGWNEAELSSTPTNLSKAEDSVEEVHLTQIISEEEKEELLLIGDFHGIKEVQLNPVSSQPDDGEPQVDDIESYKKMSLNTLKQIVLTKGLAKDVNRLKKPELLKLLS